MRIINYCINQHIVIHIGEVLPRSGHVKLQLITVVLGVGLEPSLISKNSQESIYDGV